MKLTTLSIALLSLTTSVVASQKPLAEDPDASTNTPAAQPSKLPFNIEASDSLKQHIDLETMQEIFESVYTDSESESESESTTQKQCSSGEELAQKLGKAWAETRRKEQEQQRKTNEIPHIVINLEDFEEEQCDYFERVYDGWRFTYSSKMTDCDYTGLSQTVGKAVVEFIDKKHFKKCRRDCDTMCMRFDEGGPWDGYVRLGKKDKFDPEAYYCRLSFIPVGDWTF
ncbi:hypothetical protein BO71DRAFT_399795 [Aspergillus ellipticus CBS 707.79]|uniref:Secreted protein CSS2 C-terminal domain-containing protein n=1 Tax=Aspergillus ellipticus CBS 707.79 TaxID=1448320 RepID=A0A319DYM2_9EURO|nr:hypothetical protein BO71DRAFT_399795 [Aspergillus ellipticus CBS 707.79]